MPTGTCLKGKGPSTSWVFAVIPLGVSGVLRSALMCKGLSPIETGALEKQKGKIYSVGSLTLAILDAHCSAHC